MRKFNLSLLLWLVCLIPLSLNAQVSLPFYGAGGVQTDCSGTLTDSGGPDSGYSPYDDSFITLNPDEDGYITVQFSEFDLASGDVLYISEGEGWYYSLTNLATYSGTDLPNGGEPITLETSSTDAIVSIHLAENYDYYTAGGFTMSWLVGGAAPEASFDVSIEGGTLPALIDIDFTDTSTGALSWSWDMGDGTTYDTQNVTHAFTSAGTFDVTLTAASCGGETDVYTTTVTVEDGAGVSWDPESIDVELAYGDSTFVDVTLTNTGEVDLFYEIENVMPVGNKNLQVLALLNGAREDIEYIRTIDALYSVYDDFILSEMTTYDATELEEALVGKNVLLIPEQKECDGLAFAGFADVLNDFTTNGGVLILCGSNNPECIFGMGLLDGTYEGYLDGEDYSEEMVFNDPDDDLLDDMDPYLPLTTTYRYDVTNEDFVRLIEFEGDDVLGYRVMGEGSLAGYVVLIGHNYYYSNEDMDEILGNAVQLAQGKATDWLYGETLSGVVPAGESAVIPIEFNATNVFGGVYEQDIIINTNDTENPQIVIPATMTVTGTPSFAMSQGEFDMGTWMVGLTETQQLTIFSTGTDSLHVEDIISSDPVYTTSPSTFSLYGGDSQVVDITFAPAEISEYPATLTILTNVAAFTVTLTGEGVGAPTMIVDPSEINLTLNSGETAEEIINVSNVGAGPLNYTVQQLAVGNGSNVLVYTNGPDMNPGGEYENTLAAINATFTDYDLLTTDTTDPDELATLLDESGVFLVPELEMFGGSDAFTGFAEVLQNYVTNGGSVVFCGTSNIQPLLNSGLAQGFATFDSFGDIAVVDPDHPLMAGLPETFPAQNATITANFEEDELDGEWVTLAELNGNTVVGLREMGLGRAIYIAFDYFAYDESAALCVANAVQYSLENSIAGWLSFTPELNEVDYPDGTSEIVITIDTEGLLGGTYYTEILLTTNDPLAPTFTIPITIVVVGVPDIVVTDTDLDFGSIIIGNTSEIDVLIDNPGTDSLFITEIISTFPQFTPSVPSVTVPPLKDYTITFTFAPDVIEVHDGSFTLVNNVEDQVISYVGEGKGAPDVTWTPTEINVTQLAGESTTETISLNNITGEGALNYAIANPDIPLTVGIMTAGVDLGFGSYLTLKPQLEENYPDFTFIDLSGDSYDELKAELDDNEIDVIVFPEQNTWMITEATVLDYAPAVTEFMDAGGSVIYAGTYCNYCLTAFTNTFYQDVFTGTALTVNSTDDPLGAGMEETFSTLNWGVLAYDFTDEDYYSLIDHPTAAGYSVAGYRSFGAGKAVYLGYTMDYFDEPFSQIANNAMVVAQGAPPAWFTLDNYGGDVVIGGTNEITATIDATGLLAGTYNFSLVIYTDDPDTPLIIIPVTMVVEAFPQAILGTAGGGTLSCDGIVQFADNSVNFPTEWSWDFGDGNTSTEQNPLHIYEEAGLYTVSLEACNSLGCDEQIIEDYIEVDFAASYCDTIYMPTSGNTLITSCTGVLMDDGGDGPYANNADGTVTISPPGATSISITFDVFNFETCCDDFLLYDGPDVNSTLIGNYTGGDLLGQTVTTTGGDLTVRVDTDGSVTPDGFQAFWECISVTEVPVPAFGNEVMSECEGIMQFTDTSTQYPDTWNWDFGDGNTSTEQNPEHSYAASGNYTVTLEACNIIGCETIVQEVSIQNVMFVDINFNNFIDVGIPTLFQNLTEGAVTTNWDFGNGDVTINSATAIVTYDAIGIYTVTVEVTDASGCTREHTFDIEIVSVGIDGNDPTPTVLELFPNPANDIINVNYSFNGTKDLTVNLFDALGRLVFTEKVNTTNQYQRVINLEDKARGMYLITISDGQQTDSRQIVVE